ncbi:MAG: hypothetical protein RBT49_05600 [Bacteroidales bacterium]|jgi:hypothetical protein|nr:hypothetical protein [Bacteroidales bacterium]
MSKKNFSGGIDSLFQNSKIESNITIEEKIEDKTSSYSRTTIIVNNETYEKVKAIAYWQRKSVKDIIERAFDLVLSEIPNDKLIEIINFYKQNNS